jgi:acyl-coenzyme A thioesterase PaaI-like protein
MSTPIVANRPNQLSRTLSRFQGLPAALRVPLMSFLLGKVVPFVGTASLRFDEVSHRRVVVRIRNRRKVQNHIKGVHAAAMALLAETATGFCVGMNLPDDKLPLIKSLKVDYLKRAQGDLTAVAELRPEQIHLITTQDKGEVTVPVTITDQSGAAPIQCDMVWAWVPKTRR